MHWVRTKGSSQPCRQNDYISLGPIENTEASRPLRSDESIGLHCTATDYNKKAQLSLTNPRDACEKFARFT